ncbi:MAG: AAA family ATPase [Pseudonocardia sediminis]
MNELVELLRSPGGPPLVGITGPAGSGRTTLLAELGTEIDISGSRVVPLRFTRDGSAVPAHLASRSAPAPGRVAPARDRFGPPWSPIGSADGAADDPRIARAAGAAAAAPLLVTGNAVLLVDDAQWMDRDTSAVLEAMVRRFAGSTVRVVCAVRTPVPASARAEGVRAWARLRADGLVHDVRLRPLDGDAVARALRTATGAVAAPELVARVRALSRGVPAAVRDAIEDMRADGSIRVVDRHAYLVPASGRAREPRNHLLRTVHDLGEDVWSAAKAVAVLHPLGAAAPGLVASSLGCTAAEAGALLDRLRGAGVLHRGHRGATWRFTVPLVASVLLDCLGPYERRRLSETAVRAVWDDGVVCDDPDYLTDRVADAGRLVDPVRARTELLARAPEAMGTKPDLAERWWNAAAELAPDRAQRAQALLMHAVTCFVHGDYERSMHGTQAVLRYHPEQLPAESVQEIQVMLISAMHNVGDAEALEEVAAGRRFFHGDDAARTVSRAIALSLMDRWADARRLLAGTRDVWATTAMSTALGELFEMLADLWAGRPEPLHRRLAEAGTGDRSHGTDERHRHTHVNALVTTLFCVGDLRGVEHVLEKEGLAPERLDMTNRAQLAATQGRFDTALDLGRRCIAGGTARGYDAGRSAMQQGTAYLMIARGELSRARELLATARADRPALVHLLENPEAEIDKVLGNGDAATERLTTTLDAAMRRELVVGAELTWAQLADLALDRGDHDAAVRALEGVDRVDAAMRTSRSRMYALLVRAAVDKDGAAARDTVAVCRERGQPFELGVTISKLARHGLGEPELLREAYDVFGDLDALLCRVWTRTLMLRYDVPIPGRQVTVAENERLLALLVADGLTNKQLAFVLRTSDKSVEGRLSRLFTRTGYRSRIELAAAMAAGEFEG